MLYLRPISILLTILTLTTGIMQAQTTLQPGDPVLFTAESTPVYAYPDAESEIVAIHTQGYIDRIGPAEANRSGWVLILEQAGYVQTADSGLVLRTDNSQNELLESMNEEITAKPDDYSSLMRRGNILGHMHQYDSGLADLNAAIALAPDVPRPYIIRGWIYRRTHQYHLSLADFERAIGLGTNDIWTLIGLGLSYQNLNQHDKAAQWYDEIIDHHPTALWAYNNRGVVAQDQDQDELAIEYYNQASEINAYAAFPYTNRALIYVNFGQSPAAIAELISYIGRNPYSPIAYTRLGNLYAFQLNDAEAGLRQVDTALNIDPEYGPAYEERAVINAYLVGDAQQALDDFQTAVKLNPYNLNAVDRAGILYARLGDFETAYSLYTQIDSMSDVIEPRYFLFMAQIHYGLADYEKVRATIDRFFAIESVEPIRDAQVAHLILGMTALQEGDYVEAQAHYERAFELTPQWTRDWLEKRGLRLIDSRSQLVAAYYQGIISDPDNPENYLQLAHILMEFGVWNEALDYYQQYLTLADDPTLQSLVDSLQVHLGDVVQQ